MHVSEECFHKIISEDTSTEYVFSKSFQREAMLELGVKHIYNSIKDVKEGILRMIDEEATAGNLWSDKK